MPSFNVEDDVSISSDVVLKFTDVNEQLLNKYPPGKFLSEKIQSINGLKWEVRLYPNGKSINDNMDIEFILLNANREEIVDAECHWSLTNKGKNQNYVGGIKRKSYRLNQSAIDSEFDNGILKDCISECVITIGVMQFMDDDEEQFKKDATSIISAGKKLTMNEISDDEAVLLVNLYHDIQ